MSKATFGSKKYLLRTLILAAATAVLSILPAVIAGGGMLLLADDFTWQQQVFAGFNVSLLRGFGDPAFSSLIDLGSDASNALSFYNLYSPFTLLTALFPASWAPWLAAPMLVLKYIVAAIGAFVFLGKFLKNREFAVLGALLYAFSGIQTVSLLFPFHDSMALFPWLMVAAEMALDGRPCVFALTAAVSAITNYYLFFGQVIFLVIWFIFRVLANKDLPIREKLVKLARMAFEGIAGVLLASVVLVPAFLAIISNPRLSSLNREIFFDWRTYLTILEAYFLPADVMGEGNYLFQKACSSCAIALPFAGMSLVFAYVKGNYKKTDAAFAGVLVLFSLVPLLNSAFSLFNSNYYARWFYMPALVFALLSAKALDGIAEGVPTGTPAEEASTGTAAEEAPDGTAAEAHTGTISAKAPDTPGRKALLAGSLVNLAFTVFTVLVMAAAIAYYHVKGVQSYVDGFDVPTFAVYGGCGILFAGLTAVILRIKNRATMTGALLAGVVAASILTTGAAALRYTFVKGTGDFYGSGIINSEGNPGTAFARAVITESDEFGKKFPEGDGYRVRSDWREAGEGYFVNSFDNFSMLSCVPAANSFISTVDSGLFRFYDTLGSPRLVRTSIDFTDSEMALLSCRYYLCGVKLIRPEAFSFTYSDGTTVYVYENENFIPMGFLYDSFITEEALLAAPAKDRAELMLSYAVLGNKAAEQAEALGVATKIPEAVLNSAGDTVDFGDAAGHDNTASLDDNASLDDIAGFGDIVSARRASAASSFSYTRNGFTASFDSENGGIAFFSIPYSKGWSAKVNGAPAEVFDSVGLMAVAIEGGEAAVEFSYRTPGNVEGYVLFGIGAALLAAEAVIWFIRGRCRTARKNKG